MVLDIVKGKEVEFEIDEITYKEFGLDELGFNRHHYSYKDVYLHLAEKYEGEYGRYGVTVRHKGDNYFITVGYDGYLRVKTNGNTIFKGQLLSEKIEVPKKVRKYISKAEKENIWYNMLTEGLNLPKFVREDLFYLMDVADKEDELVNEINKILKDNKVDLISEKGDWKWDLIENLKMNKNFVRDKASSTVRGAGITLIKPNEKYVEYRSKLDKIIEGVKKKSKRVVGYKILYSNTTTSCYIDFKILGIEEDFKVTVRNHDIIKENLYYKVYVADENLDGLEERLIELIKTHIELTERGITNE